MKPTNVAIIGAGCAGISAHVWLCELQIQHQLFEGKRRGGMLHRVYNTIENYPPQHYRNGAELAEELDSYLEKTICSTQAAEVFVKEEIVNIRKSSAGFVLKSNLGTEREFTHVLLATGTRYRQLDIPGYEQSASFISQSTTYTAPSVAGEKVLIVGGGDAAFEGARILVEHDCEIVLSARSAYCARPEFVSFVTKSKSVTLMDIGILPTEFVPRESDIEIIFSDGTSDTFKKVFVRIGVDPILPKLFSECKTDGKGYLRTDHNCETSIPGIFAIGDVSVAPLQSIATAIGDGARAAKAIQVLTR